MKKITRKHVQAVGHGKLFLNKAFATNPEPRFKQEIERDMERLDEVEKFLLHTLYNPDLPYPVDKLDSDIEALHKEHGHGPTNAG